MFIVKNKIVIFLNMAALLGRVGIMLGKYGKYAPTALKGVAGLSAANMIGLDVPIFSDVFNFGADTLGVDVGQGGITQTMTQNPMLIIVMILVILVILRPIIS
jgi:hypothetical protein